MRKQLFLILFLIPLSSWAQYNITGKVIDLYNKKPIVKASVFLSNTTVGTATSEEGSYALTGAKLGQYDLVISAIGYETSHQTVTVNGNTTIEYTELTPKTIDLKAVEVKPDPDWERNYKIFRAEFLGEGDFAQQCKILNPEVLNLSFDKSKNMLIASSNDYIEIENTALGYKVKYQLIDFARDYRNQSFFYQGNVLFIPIQGKPRQQKKWIKNRLEAYQGSVEHYLRSLITLTNTTEGFKTLTLIRKPNPERPPDSLIQAKLKQFRIKALNGKTIVISDNDSVSYWNRMNRLPKIVDYLVSKPLKVDSLVRRTDQKGIFALGYEHTLYVLYTKKKDNGSYVNRPLNSPDNLTSLMNFKNPYIFFDHNGVIINPTSVIYEGN